MAMVGDAKPVAFVEDTAVSPDRLPEFYDRFEAIVARHGVRGRVLRPRRRRLPAHPADHQRQDRRRGGDAPVDRARGLRPGRRVRRRDERRARRRPGPQPLEPQALRARGLRGVRGGQARLRPRQPPEPRQGRRHAPTRATTSGSAPTITPTSRPTTLLDFSGQGGFARAVEMCSGVGACRKTEHRHDVPQLHGHPRRDAHDPRPRQRPAAGDDRRPARRRRLARTRPSTRPSTSASSARRARASARRNVDMAKLKAEFLHQYYGGRPVPLGHAADGPHLPAQPDRLGHSPRWPTATLRQPALQVAPREGRRASTAGGPCRPSSATTSAGGSAGTRPIPAPGRAGRSSCSTTASRRTTTPRSACAAVRVLEAAGYRVELAGLRCCGRPAISKGLLTLGRDLARGERRAAAAACARRGCRSSAASRAAC